MKAPDLMIHTGDITQNSKTQEFDTAMQVIKGAKVGEVFYVPGEHDYSLDDGALYKQHFGKGTLGNGWYSLNHKGVHFVGLNNLRTGRRDGQFGRGSACMAEVRPCGIECFNSDCGVRAHSVVDGLREMGLGHLTMVNRLWRC